VLWCSLLCSVRLYAHLFVWWPMSYLHYLCVIAYSVVQHILCCVFCLACLHLLSCVPNIVHFDSSSVFTTFIYLSLPLLLLLYIWSKESEWSCICVLGVSSFPLLRFSYRNYSDRVICFVFRFISTIFPIRIWNVPTMRYFPIGLSSY
jgi:hypothetical protein